MAPPKKLCESYYFDNSVPIPTESLLELIRKSCTGNEECHVTFINPWETFTHRQLYEKAMDLARGLLDIGLKRGDSFCSFGSQGSDSVLLLIACLSIGLKYTANYLYSPISNVMTMMIKKIKPTAVLIGNCTSGKYQEHVCTEFTKVISEMAAGEGHGISYIFYDKHAAADPKCSILSDWKPFADLINVGKEKLSEEQLIAAQSLVKPEDPFLYLCSSGSTGDPKIITISNRSISIAYGYFHLDNKPEPLLVGLEITNTETVGCNDVMEGDAKLILALFGCLVGNNNLVIYPATNSCNDQEAIDEILEITQNYRIKTIVHRMDYLIQIVDNPPDKSRYEISASLALGVGGCLSSLEFKNKLMEFAPLSGDGYGGTEFMFATNPVPLSQLPPKKRNSVGKARRFVELKIIDEEGVTVPVNTKGELCVRGWCLFLEYKDQPELTAKVMDKYGWYHTGDMVSMDEDGFLYVYGRISNAERWKINGKVVYSISIENVLMKHPSVRTCAVIGTNNGKGHDLNYVIEPAPGSGLTVEDVEKFAKENMYNSLEWPIRIFFYKYADIPKTNGSRPKLDRKALTEEIKRRVAQNPSEGRVVSQKALETATGSRIMVVIDIIVSIFGFILCND